MGTSCIKGKGDSIVSQFSYSDVKPDGSIESSFTLYIPNPPKEHIEEHIKLKMFKELMKDIVKMEDAVQ